VSVSSAAVATAFSHRQWYHEEYVGLLGECQEGVIGELMILHNVVCDYK